LSRLTGKDEDISGEILVHADTALLQELNISPQDRVSILNAVYDWKVRHAYPIEPYDYRPPLETLLSRMEGMWKSELQERDAIMSGLMDEVKRLQGVVAQLQSAQPKSSPIPPPAPARVSATPHPDQIQHPYEARIPIMSSIWSDPPSLKGVKLTQDETVGELLSKSVQKFAKPEHQDDVYTLVLQHECDERVLDLIEKPLQLFQSLAKPGQKPPIFLLEVGNHSWASASRPLSDELVNARRASVLFPYTARAGNELTIHPGQIVLVLKRHGNWVLVERSASERGWIPLSYLTFEFEEALSSPPATNLHRSGSTESVASRLRRTRSLSDIGDAPTSQRSSLDKLDELLGLLDKRT